MKRREFITLLGGANSFADVPMTCKVSLAAKRDVLPLPVQVLPALSRYLTATFRPFHYLPCSLLLLKQPFGFIRLLLKLLAGVPSLLFI
jgi:hypothetical protein